MADNYKATDKITEPCLGSNKYCDNNDNAVNTLENLKEACDVDGKSGQSESLGMFY